MSIFVIWIVLSILVGFWSSRLNRTGFLWFLFSLIFSPILTWLILLTAGKYKSKEDLKSIADSYTMKKDAFLYKYTLNIEQNKQNKILVEMYSDICAGKTLNIKTLDNALSIM